MYLAFSTVISESEETGRILYMYTVGCFATLVVMAAITYEFNIVTHIKVMVNTADDPKKKKVGAGAGKKRHHHGKSHKKGSKRSKNVKKTTEGSVSSLQKSAQEGLTPLEDKGVSSRGSRTSRPLPTLASLGLGPEESKYSIYSKSSKLSKLSN